MLRGALIDIPEDCENLLLEKALQLIEVLNLLAVSAEAKIPKHLLCDFAAEVGIDEDSFELIESVAIYLLVDGDEIIDSFAEVLTSARNSVTHPPEEGAFTFFCLFFLLL